MCSLLQQKCCHSSKHKNLNHIHRLRQGCAPQSKRSSNTRSVIREASIRRWAKWVAKAIFITQLIMRIFMPLWKERGKLDFPLRLRNPLRGGLAVTEIRRKVVLALWHIQPKSTKEISVWLSTRDYPLTSGRSSISWRDPACCVHPLHQLLYPCKIRRRGRTGQCVRQRPRALSRVPPTVVNLQVCTTGWALSKRLQLWQLNRSWAIRRRERRTLNKLVTQALPNIGHRVASRCPHSSLEAAANFPLSQ